MKTILAANESIAKLWGAPKPKETTYRLMKYILRVEVEDGVLLHNNVTGHLILLTNEEAELLSKLPVIPTESVRELIADHFLVPESFDEYSSVKQLRRVFHLRNTSEFINDYIILPTTFCNAHCFYCYESDYPRVHMTEETADKLVEFMAKNRKDKPLEINWFGGEPLVGIKRIDQISQALKDREIPYSSSMISNGYLFDEEIADRCISLWNLKRIQITLDGTEEVYNQVKSYANAEENPFQRVLRNIDLLASRKILVNIRLNVGFHNKDDIQVLIEQLGEKYSGNQNIGVYPTMLYDGVGFEAVKRSLDETFVLQKLADELTGRLKEFGLLRVRQNVPMLQVQQCIADNPHSIVIQPDGGFCRCEHENVLESYGNLDDGVLDPQKPLKWTETIERTDHCDECPMYPSCYLLRYCINARRECIEEFRSRFIRRNEDVIHTKYKKSLEDKSHEKV